MSDPDQKTLRSFACRDRLWGLFGEMATELECSVDYLINEAMRQYARSRRGDVEAAARALPGPSLAAPPGPAGAPRKRPTIPPAPPPRLSEPTFPAPPRSPRLETPPPLPGPARRSGRPRERLFILFEGKKIPVTKDEFVIGRGAKTADLPIKDGNISRRHAVIVWDEEGYRITDLGSTNGLEFRGQRIRQKTLAEGDVIQVCDYELRFTFR
ncbi:MAG: FHA domain-containing protein [Myxococcota bacterium]